MSIALDLIILVILGLTIFFAAKKGFVKTLIDLIGFVAAIIIAFSFSTPLASFTYDKAIEPMVVGAVDTAISETIQQSTEIAEESVEEALSSLPSFIGKFAEQSGFSADKFVTDISSGIIDTTEISGHLCNNIIEPAVISIIKYIFVILLFIIALIIFKFVGRIINSIFKKGLLGTANTALGAVCGALKGAIYIIIFCLVVSLISNVIPSAESISLAIEKTVVFKAILGLIPFTI